MNTLTRWTRPLTLLLATLTPACAAAQDQGFDEIQVVLAYHKLTKQPLNIAALAEQSDAVRTASQFDRPDVLTAETARLEKLLVDANVGREFTIQISDNISQYDHDKAEFSIGLFSPGYYIPVTPWGEEYQIVFSNAASARRIPMPKDQAREFDQKMMQMGRRVLNVLRFRITGKGDPSGGVTGERVIRAELLASRIEDGSGNLIFAPKIGPAPAAIADAADNPAVAFDASRTDIAGLKVGVPAKVLEATLTRLYGKAVRGGLSSQMIPAMAGAIDMNSSTCYSMFGGKEAYPGTVCIMAMFDKDDIVRSIRIERIFPWFDQEVFRKELTAMYGPVANARGGGGYMLGWGPEIKGGDFYATGGSYYALTATIAESNSLSARSGNAIPKLSVVLQLIDAGWVAKQK